MTDLLLVWEWPLDAVLLHYMQIPRPLLVFGLRGKQALSRHQSASQVSSNTLGKRIFVPEILVANASIDFLPRRILKYSSEAIRPIYA